MSSQQQQQDWVSNWRSYMVAWGIPTAIFILGIFIAPPMKIFIWTTALLWKGTACLANAARCGRTHCYFTGPIYILLAVLVVLHGFEIFWLGPNGWVWLGVAVLGGMFGIWFVTEKIWGKFV